MRSWGMFAGLAAAAALVLNACSTDRPAPTPFQTPVPTPHGAAVLAAGVAEWPIVPGRRDRPAERLPVRFGSSAHQVSPAEASAGATVSLSGPAEPGTPMSAYFECDNLCGNHHVGAERAGADGRYSITFTVPQAAKPGGTSIWVGCDTPCPNGWRQVRSFQVKGDSSAAAGGFVFQPATADPGGLVVLTGNAAPNSHLSAYFYCDARCGSTHVGLAQVGGDGAFRLEFRVPVEAQPGGATLWIGCDTPCVNGWRELRGLTISSAAPVGGSHTFSPGEAQPGDSVTLSGPALPGSYMSGYFQCDTRCGLTHIGAATAGADGRYSLAFKVPTAAVPGPITVVIGCDSPCANGWRDVRGLTIKPPPGQSDEEITQRINESYLRAFGRPPTEGELAQWRRSLADATFASDYRTTGDFIEKHHRPLLARMVQEREPTVRRAFVELAYRPSDTVFNEWVATRSIGLVYEEMLVRFKEVIHEQVIGALLDDSHMRALGRLPTESERQAWMDAVKKDQRLESVHVLVALHRKALKEGVVVPLGSQGAVGLSAASTARRSGEGGASLDRDVVERALGSVSDQRPSVKVVATWQAELASNNWIYPELAAKISDRRALVETAYRRQMGRLPDEAEYETWLAVPSSDARVGSADALVKHLQAGLRSWYNPSENYDLVRRAYFEAIGIPYRQDDFYLNIFENLDRYPLNDVFGIGLREVQNTAPPYHDLVWKLRYEAAFRAALGRAPKENDQMHVGFGIICDDDCNERFLRAWTYNSTRDAFTERLKQNVRQDRGREVLEGAMDAGLRYPYHRQVSRPGGPEDWTGSTRAETLAFLQTDVEQGRLRTYWDLLRAVWVRKAHVNTYGRQPTEGEFEWWMSLPSTDSRVQGWGPVLNGVRDVEWTSRFVRSGWRHAAGEEPSDGDVQRVAMLFRNKPARSTQDVVAVLRKELAQGEARRRMIERAYLAVYDRPPLPHEYNLHGDRVFTEIAESLAATLVRFTFDKLIGDAPDRHTEQAYVNALVYTGLTPRQLWNQVARSQQRLDKFGYYAPSRAEDHQKIVLRNWEEGGYRDYWAFQDDQGRWFKAEECFGDIGPGGCNGPQDNIRDAAKKVPGGNPAPKPERIDYFTTPDGRMMFYVRNYVAVGSIVHDEACRQVLSRDQEGAWCNGFDQGLWWESRLVIDIAGLFVAVQSGGTGQAAKVLADLAGAKVWSEYFGKGAHPAAKEWNKAVWNNLQGRWWENRFGPYESAEYSIDRRDPRRTYPYRLPDGSINPQYDGQMDPELSRWSDDLNVTDVRSGLSTVVAYTPLTPQQLAQVTSRPDLQGILSQRPLLDLSLGGGGADIGYRPSGYGVQDLSDVPGVEVTVVVTEAPAAKLAPLVFGLGYFEQTEPYRGTETRSTRALQAKPGTALDVTDAAFCASRAFAGGTNAGITKWGVCR